MLLRLAICFPFVLFLAGIPAFASPSRAVPSQAHASSPEKLYRSGKVQEAREQYMKLLSRAEASANKKEVWRILQRFAWFESEVGEYDHAILLSNRAFEIAASLDDTFMLGRSLDWLGWAYAAQGYYEVAVSFYSEAAALGKKEGKVIQPAVWGLATQELGATYYKMGDAAEAKRLLTETVAYAREHHIPVGVAEGGAELAEILLDQGSYSEALKLAREALTAAEKSGCSPYNLARAKFIYAKVLSTNFHSTAHDQDVLPAIEAAIEQAKRTGNTRYVAEGKLLLSSTLAPSEFSRKEELIDDALQDLENIRSELRGVANLEKARLFIENNRETLAEFYLARGIDVHQRMLRNIDNAYVSKLKAAQATAQGDREANLIYLSESFDRALESGKTVMAADLSLKLALEYQSLGFDSLALRFSRKGLTLHEQIMNTEEDPEHLEYLRKQRLQLKSLLAELEVGLLPRAHSGG